MTIIPRTDLEPLDQDAIVESIVFVADRPVELNRIAVATGFDRDTIDAALERIRARHARSGIRLQRLNGAVTLVTAPEAAEAVAKFLGLGTVGRLSNAALETLAIIAYRQPVTRAEIEAVRGVNPDHALGILVARSLVVETGRRETVGRPMTFGTTFEFLQQFGLSDLNDLPDLPDEFLPIAERASEAISG